jgi:CRISPR/Cas system CSM-associated protein Csm3 (group 7 of RAMP superfamily)
MRDRERLLRDGRNDPDSPDQQREHPYDFVALPDRPLGRLKREWLDRRRLGAGLWLRLKLRFTLQQPVAVGTGVIGTVAGRPVRLAVDTTGQPVVPGTSLKGAMRSIYEAITHSCVWNGQTAYKENPEKLPRALQPRGYPRDVIVRIERPPPSLAARCDPKALALCPACGLFGALGYRGRVGFQDATVVAAEPMNALRTYDHVPAQNSGQAHRSGYAEARDNEVLLTQLWGRRVPLRPQAPRRAALEEGMERVQALSPGTVIETDVSFIDARSCEVGGVLIAAGWREPTGLLRLGGFKSAGFGAVTTEVVSVAERRKAALAGAPADDACAAWVSDFLQWSERWPTGLQELRAILVRPFAGQSA